MADLHTSIIKEQDITVSKAERGKELLPEAWIEQGFERLENQPDLQCKC